MKQFLLAMALMCLSVAASAQLKQDGSPDMRYRANREAYGTGYSGSTSSFGQTNQRTDYQRAYERNGTQVEGSYHTRPNDTNTDNWSTSGNVNPLTNERGSRARDYSPEALNYGQGQSVQTGSRGGQYYINSNGNRVYVPKQP